MRDTFHVGNRGKWHVGLVVTMWCWGFGFAAAWVFGPYVELSLGPLRVWAERS